MGARPDDAYKRRGVRADNDNLDPTAVSGLDS